MTNAISWAAVSSKPQADRESLHDQHRLNHALAEALEWDVVADITVPGESCSYFRLDNAQANLEAYRTLQEHATNGHIQWLICKDRSRLARTQRLNREVAGYLQDHGIRVYSRTMPPSDTDRRTEADVWGEAIESGFSEAEILRLVQRREMGMQARVRAGKMPSTPPWGFKRVANEQGDVSCVFGDPRAEEAFTFIISRYLAGVSINHIIEEARERGLRRAEGAGDWKYHTIRSIVLQANYYGLVAWGRRRKTNNGGKYRNTQLPPSEWPIAEADFAAPFTPEDWNKTLAELARRRAQTPTHSWHSVYALRPPLVCSLRPADARLQQRAQFLLPVFHSMGTLRARQSQALPGIAQGPSAIG